MHVDIFFSKNIKHSKSAFVKKSKTALGDAIFNK